MGERPVGEREKIPTGQVLLLGEPMFKMDQDQSNPAVFTVPLGSEAWIEELLKSKPDDETIVRRLSKEYSSIASALSQTGASFRIINSEKSDQIYHLSLRTSLRVRGLMLHSAIGNRAFPRDMMVVFDGRTYVNPESNFGFSDNSGIMSPLGEGGRVLKRDKKLFVPDPRGFVKTRKEYEEHIARLRIGGFEFGFLPHPWAIAFNTKDGSTKTHTNDHLDRVASLVESKDGMLYLLLDKNYVDQRGPFGSYWKSIKDACERLEVKPIIVERPAESIPYALNLEQLGDNTILVTGGDSKLKGILDELVGPEKVKTTDFPVIFYPLYRGGGIRCMLLFAPQKLVGAPVIG